MSGLTVKLALAAMLVAFVVMAVGRWLTTLRERARDELESRRTASRPDGDDRPGPRS